MFQRYATSLINLFVVIFGAIATVHVWTVVAGLQFIPIIVAAIVAFGVPLVKGPWSGLLKTGFGLLGAIATALIPLAVNHTLTFTNWAVVGIAILTAAGTQLGIAIRLQPTDADDARVTSIKAYKAQRQLAA